VGVADALGEHLELVEATKPHPHLWSSRLDGIGHGRRKQSC